MLVEEICCYEYNSSCFLRGFMQTLILGDLHGDFDALNAFIAQTTAHTLIICGDFGYWPSYGMDVTRICNVSAGRHGQTVEIRFCDGNHEEHPRLQELVLHASHISPLSSVSIELAHGIFYQPRGSVWIAPRGERVLFAGGALSTDGHLRTEGEDWFPNLELLQRTDLPPVLPRADVVISHTAPCAFGMERKQHNAMANTPEPSLHDPSCDVLDIILHEVRPKRWYFGHFHEAEKGVVEGCHWQCLPPCHDRRPENIKRLGIPNSVSVAVL